MMNRVDYNPDQQVFKSINGTNEIRLNFSTDEFFITDGDAVSKVKFHKDYQMRGEFFYLTRTHALWLLKKQIDVPSSWNNNKKEGLQRDTPVVILFKDRKEEYRLTMKDLGFSQMSHFESTEFLGRHGPVKYPAADTWLTSYSMFVPNPGPLSNINAFVPRLTLQEENHGRTVEISVLNKQIKAIDGSPIEKTKSVQTPINITTTKAQQEYISKLAIYNKSLQDLANWYQEQIKSLNTQADKLSDRDLNQAMEKLTADYHRKSLKIQAEMPVLQNSTERAK